MSGTRSHNSGFTPQYTGLEKLFTKYKDQGFEVLGFPSNDFMHQDPGTDEEIAQFCQVNHGVTFPLAKKVSGEHDESMASKEVARRGTGARELEELGYRKC